MSIRLIFVYCWFDRRQTFHPRLVRNLYPRATVKGNSLALTTGSRGTIPSTVSYSLESSQVSLALWHHFSTSTKSPIRWQRAGRNPGARAKSFSLRRRLRNPRHWRTLGYRKFSRPFTATRWQAIQKYFYVRFVPHLFKINNDLYALSAVGTYEEVVGIEDPRHGGMEGSRHGWSDYRLASLQALRTVMSEGNFG